MQQAVRRRVVAGWTYVNLRDGNHLCGPYAWSQLDGVHRHGGRQSLRGGARLTCRQREVLARRRWLARDRLQLDHDRRRLLATRHARARLRYKSALVRAVDVGDKLPHASKPISGINVLRFVVSLCARRMRPIGQPCDAWPVCVDVCVDGCHASNVYDTYEHCDQRGMLRRCPIDRASRPRHMHP